jgi:hypothetical protein
MLFLNKKGRGIAKDTGSGWWGYYRAQDVTRHFGQAEEGRAYLN